MRLQPTLYLWGVLLFIFSCTSDSDDITAEPETPTQSENPDDGDDELGGDNDESGSDPDGDGQGSEEESHGGEWIIYNSENSPLINDVITDVEFDSDGTAWLVTYYNSNSNGVVSFDGENWVTFNSENSGLYDDRIVDLAIDEVDGKWIASWKAGLTWLNNGEYINYSTSNSNITSDNLTAIDIDQDNYKWIGTESDGLIRFRSGEWKVFNSDNSPISSNLIYDINVDKDNNTWVLTENELVEISDGELEIHSYQGLFYGRESIAFNGEEVWIAAEYGVASLINNEWTYYDFFEDDNCLIDCQAEHIQFVDGKLWIGNFSECGKGGFLNFTDCEVVLEENSGLPANPIMTFNVDADGDFWIGTYGGGIAIWGRE
jgi:ligand-binding sensor domain-containing protein